MKMNLGNEQDQLYKAQNGDLTALGSIYDLYNQGLYRYAVRLLGEESLAEDCVSETFSRFLQALQQKKGPKDHLQAYLYRIAHNWITDCYRKKDFFSIQINEDAYISHEPSVEAQSTLQSEKEKVRRALQMLPPNQRLVITLRYFEEWDNETISAALKKPVGAIKALQHRAMMNLRRKLCVKE